jgi:hypothetical protein
MDDRAQSAGESPNNGVRIALLSMSCIIVLTYFTSYISNPDLLAARAASNSRFITNSRLSFLVDDDDDDDEMDPDYVDNDDDEDWQDEDSLDYLYNSTRDNPKTWVPPAVTPQEAGIELIKGGDFGRVTPKTRARRGHNNLAKVISNRLSRPHPALYKEDYAAVSSSFTTIHDLMMTDCIFRT